MSSGASDMGMAADTVTPGKSPTVEAILQESYARAHQAAIQAKQTLAKFESEFHRTLSEHEDFVRSARHAADQLRELEQYMVENGFTLPEMNRGTR